MEKENKKLKINPLLKPSHLQYYFSCSQSKASRLMKQLKDFIGKPILTFEHFFNEFQTFPDPKFKPIWI